MLFFRSTATIATVASYPTMFLMMMMMMLICTTASSTADINQISDDGHDYDLGPELCSNYSMPAEMADTFRGNISIVAKAAMSA